MTQPVPDPTPATARAPAAARLPPALGLVWLLVVLVVLAHQWTFWHADRLDSDVLALLPQDEQSPNLSRATRQIADSASRSIVVLVGAKDASAAMAAARRFDDVWRARDGALASGAAPSLGTAREAVDALLPWRDRLLTSAQRERLQRAAPAALAETALASLHQPGAGMRLTEWRADPLGLWPQWWSQRLAGTPARLRDDLPAFRADDMEWVLLSHDVAGSAFALDGNAVHATALRAAEAAALALAPQARVLAAGVPLHAEAAAARASDEINLIGWGSLAAIVALMWLAFRSLWPIVLVVLTLAVGTLAALSATAAVFGKVHLITLVFGASLVGVAEDFGIHYFASRVGYPEIAPQRLLRVLLPGLLLALATSVIAYLMLGLAPFPGLRQMALFSAVGLVAAFMTMACWFTLLDRGQPRASAFASAIGASLARWPRARASRSGIALAGALALLAAAGIARLQTNDDIRSLQSSPPALLKAQREVQALLRLSSPAQFIWVAGATPEEVLQREESLKPLLDANVVAGALKGYLAFSDWVPSIARQQADAALTAHVETQVLEQVSAALGEDLRRPAFDAAPLTPQDVLARPQSVALRALWLADAGRGPGSVILLQDPGNAAQTAGLRASMQGLVGVRWVDKPAEISDLMTRYRGWMSLLLVLGHAAVLLALWWRYGHAAWRAWVPTVLASVLSLAVLGWMGESLQIFNVLALILLLGIGVDYGIFLLEHDGDGSAWLAVVLGAASTLLSFGLLGLSGTPALRAFGLTMALGTASVWLLAPMFRPGRSPPSRP